MIRVGIIGLGVGEAHISGYERYPGCLVNSICDFDKEKLARIGANYPEKKLCASPKEILTDPEIDVVSIASFDNFHCEQILMAIAHDKHVFVEKPLCLYKEEAQQIYKALQGKPTLKISSNLILRQSERFTDFKKRIDEGQLGDVFHIRGAYNYGRLHKITEGWRGKLDFYSVVYGGGVHLIDLMLWLTNDKVDEVSAYGNNLCSKESQYKFDDLIVGIMKFKSGITGEVTSNYGAVQPHFHQLDIYGTKATLQNGLNNATMYLERDASDSVELKTAYPGIHKGDLLYNFIESIVLDKEPIVSKREIFDVMDVCFAIEESKQSGVPIKVQYIHG